MVNNTLITCILVFHTRNDYTNNFISAFVNFINYCYFFICVINEKIAPITLDMKRKVYDKCEINSSFFFSYCTCT